MDDYKQEKRKSFWGGLLTGVLVSGIILTSVFIILINKNEKVYRESISALSTSGNISSGALITKDFANKAERVYSGILSEFYFDSDIDENLMRENMFKAIIASLGDKYAEYYTAEEMTAMFEDSEGIYYGIGSYVMMDEETGYPILSGVFANSPASEAGLRDGDIIYEVDGVNHFGETLDDWVSLIKGPEGTTVDLTIYRQGEPDYLHITVTRRKVESPTVVYEMYDNKIGYIQITEFDDVTTGQFSDAYSDLNSQGMKALIIDLRSNGGGNLDTVLAIADEMLPKGIITYTEDRFGNRENYTSKGNSEIEIPVAVLTNEYTASASELLTGALKDYNKAVSIGTNTYGKGIVQTIFPLDDGSGIKLTTSRYYTPNGTCIHEVGIAPDIELEFDSESYYSEESVDNQLEYAKNYLFGVVSGKAE